MMFAVTGALAFVVTVLYGWRTGQLARRMPWAEIGARLSVGLILATTAHAFIQRAGDGLPFLWYHWLIFASFVGGGICYLLLLPRRR